MAPGMAASGYLDVIPQDLLSVHFCWLLSVRLPTHGGKMNATLQAATQAATPTEREGFIPYGSC